MSQDTRKTIFGCSTQVQHQSGCKTTCDVSRFEISYLGSRGIAKSKVLITQLICAFVFEYAKGIINSLNIPNGKFSGG